MSGDYLWDGSGEPDREIQRLENLLRPCAARDRRRSRVFGVLGRGCPLVAGAPWRRPRRCRWPWPRRSRGRARPPPHRSRPRAGRSRGSRARPGSKRGCYGRPGWASASGSTPAREGPGSRSAESARCGWSRPRASGCWTRASAAPPLAHAGRPARRDLGAAGTVPRRHAVGRRRRPGLQLHARGGGGRLRPPARRDGVGGLREPRAAVARPRRRRLRHAARSRAGHAVLRDRARGPAPGARGDRLRLRRARKARRPRARARRGPRARRALAVAPAVPCRRGSRPRLRSAQSTRATASRCHARGHPARRSGDARPLVGRARPRVVGFWRDWTARWSDPKTAAAPLPRGRPVNAGRGEASSSTSPFPGG